MIRELVCCLVDLKLRVRDIEEQVCQLDKLKFLKEPLEISLEKSVYARVQAHAQHAKTYMLPYLVTNLLQLCLGMNNKLHHRDFMIALAPNLNVYIKSYKFDEHHAQKCFELALRSWFEEQCRLHTAVYSFEHAFEPLFRNT